MNKNLLLSAMAKAGITSSELSARIGVNQSTLYRKIKGFSDFNRNELQIIKSVLSLTVNEFEKIFFEQ